MTRRLPCQLLLLTTLTACGDADPVGVSPDAASPDAAPVTDAPLTDAPVVDAPPPVDAGLDAFPDGPGDPPLPPMERSQAGGGTTAVAIAGHRAYVGVGPRLTVWDLSGGPPARLGESAPLAGVINGIEVVGDTVYVVSAGYADGAFHVIDATDPTTPVERAHLRLGTGAYSHPAAIDVDGATAYVADTEQGVFRLDLAAPLQPVVTAFQPASSMSLIEVHGGRVHAAGAGFAGYGVRTFDATSAGLTPLGTAFIPDAMAAALTDDGLLVSRNLTGFAVDDLSVPAAPRRIHSEAISAWAIAPGDGGAWLTVGGALRFLDLRDRAAIHLGPAHGDDVWAVAASAFAGDRLAFTTHQGGLRAFALAAGVPGDLGAVATGPCAHCYATASHADRLIVAESTPGAVGSIGTADLADLELDGQHVQLSTDFEDIAYAGGRAYVADWFSGLRVFDVTDPAHPTAVSVALTGTYPSAVAVSGTHVYLGESTNGGALRVLSHHGAGDPVELGAIATGQVADVAVANGLVFTAEGSFDGTGGMRIYDATAPAAIARVATHACPRALGVAVEHGLALVACTDGVHVVDVRDPAAPTRLATWLPSLAGAEAVVVALDGARGYVGHRRGVTVLDLATPSAPAALAELPTAWMVRDLTVAGPGRVVAATWHGGVYQWEL